MSKSLNAKLEDFYPRSPCGERPGCQRPCERPTRDFYPRSPCGERRPHGQKHIYSRAFLSTLSLRRATDNSRSYYHLTKISIHALLAESDYRTHSRSCCRSDFYPRSPCGERRRTAYYFFFYCYFYPRSPCGERHYFSGVMRQNPGISIHALLAESDQDI